MRKMHYFIFVTSLILSFLLGIIPVGAVTVDSNVPDLTVQLSPGEPLDLNCKAEPGQKIWVFLEVPSSYPGIEFVRPYDSHCQEHGRYLFVFVPNQSEDLYYADSYTGTRIEFGVQDFTGLGEVIVTTKKGHSSANLEMIQRIKIIESLPCEKIEGTWFELVAMRVTMTFYGETSTYETDPGYRWVTIKQNGCSVEWNYDEGDGYEYRRTGDVTGNLVKLSGQCTDAGAFSNIMEDDFREEGLYGVNVAFTTNTARGEGVISGNTIDYEGSCHLEGTFRYYGRSHRLSISIDENSTLTRVSTSTIEDF
jgi:hypothetical protein